MRDRGNPYKDDRGHFTTEGNDGGECPHEISEIGRYADSLSRGYFKERDAKKARETLNSAWEGIRKELLSQDFSAEPIDPYNEYREFSDEDREKAMSAPLGQQAIRFRKDLGDGMHESIDFPSGRLSYYVDEPMSRDGKVTFQSASEMERYVSYPKEAMEAYGKARTDDEKRKAISDAIANEFTCRDYIVDGEEGGRAKRLTEELAERYLSSKGLLNEADRDYYGHISVGGDPYLIDGGKPMGNVPCIELKPIAYDGAQWVNAESIPHDREYERMPMARRYIDLRSGDTLLTDGSGNVIGKTLDEVIRKKEESNRRADEAWELEKSEKEKGKKARSEMEGKWGSASDSEKRDYILSGYPLDGFLSDNDLTSGERVGGYIGKSMSRSAAASYGDGSMPISRWSKSAILGWIRDSTDELNPVMGDLERLPLKSLREICLKEDGWHHTGKFYSKTDFYSLSSPLEIAERLGDIERERRKAMKLFGLSGGKEIK